MSETDKPGLRRELRARLKALDPVARAAGSAALVRRALTLPEWIGARCVLLFAPLADEPDVWPLVAHALAVGKETCLPALVPARGVYAPRRISDPARDLVTGAFGVREPVPACPEVSWAKLDLVLVPGLAFTPEGVRLGRGKGYYDRLLEGTPAVRIGVALEEQILAWLPSEPHDAKLDYILTPSATNPCRRPSD